MRIAVLGQEREHGRFRASTEGARGNIESTGECPRCFLLSRLLEISISAESYASPRKVERSIGVLAVVKIKTPLVLISIPPATPLRHHGSHLRNALPAHDIKDRHVGPNVLSGPIPQFHRQ